MMRVSQLRQSRAVGEVDRVRGAMAALLLFYPQGTQMRHSF